jgi:hypothetical protein
MRNNTRILTVVAVALLALGSAANCVRAQNVQDNRNTLYVPDQDYIQAPLPPGDEKYAHIDPAAIKTSELEIVAISEKSRSDGNQYWGRIAGTRYDRMTSDYMMYRFQKLGLEQVRRQEFDLPPQWLPQSWEADLETDGKVIPLSSAYPVFLSTGTKAGPVEAEAVWVGLGTAADFADRNVAGKAVFMQSWPTPGGLSHSAIWNGGITRALKSGAALVFVVSGFPGNVTHLIQYGWAPGSYVLPPLTAVPAMALGNKDGTSVRELIEKGAHPKIRLRFDVQIQPGLKTNSVWGVLPGQTDENILVMAHHDAFFDGALDNASGMAMLLEIAKYYAAIPKSERRRNMVFLDDSTHHTPGIAGATWIRENMHDFLLKTAFIVNCEHPAATDTYLVGAGMMTSDGVSAARWFASGSDKFKSLISGTLRQYNVPVYQVPEARAGGDLGQLTMTTPSFHIINHIFYHTDMDTPDWTPPSRIAVVTRAYLKIIDNANGMTQDEIRGSFHPSFDRSASAGGG